MNKKLKVRHWSLSSHGALLGKSTFIAANCRAPIVVVDTDGRFDAVEALVQGEVIYPSQVIDPLTLAEELMELCGGGKVGSIAFDSLTKLYSIHARMAYMRNISGRGSTNRASEMVHKANAMTIARDMAMLGTDMYYSMHTMVGVDGQGKTEIRAMISEVERSRLQTSINVELEFVEQGGVYGVRVVSARDFGGRRANTGFTLWDEPGNYWRDKADWLEELMYTSFLSKDEAIRWTARELEIEIDEADGVYENIKDIEQPKTTALMWVELVTQVRQLAQARSTDLSPEKEVSTIVVTPEVNETDTEDSTPANTDPDLPEIHPDEEFSDYSPPSPNEELFPTTAQVVVKMRAHLEGIAEKREEEGMGKTLMLGQIAYAIKEAKPDRYDNIEQVLEVLAQLPSLPDDYTWELDKVVTTSGGQKFFDFATQSDIM